MHARSITNVDRPPPFAIIRSAISQTDDQMTVETTFEIHVDGRRLPVLTRAYVKNGADERT